MPSEQTRTPILSPKGILALSVVWVYVGMWAYAVYKVLGAPVTDSFDPMEFLLQFAGATGVMGMIVLLIIQNFFRKTEAG